MELQMKLKRYPQFLVGYLLREADGMLAFESFMMSNLVLRSENEKVNIICFSVVYTLILIRTSHHKRIRNYIRKYTTSLWQKKT